MNTSILSSLSDEMTLNVLNDLFETHQIPKNLYSLNGYAEDRICMEKQGRIWTVYTGSRGRKLDLKEYDGIEKACEQIIGEVTDSCEEEREVKESFARCIDELPVKSIYKNGILIYYPQNCTGEQQRMVNKIKKIMFFNAQPPKPYKNMDVAFVAVHGMKKRGSHKKRKCYKNANKQIKKR